MKLSDIQKPKKATKCMQINVRITEEQSNLLYKHNISPTALFNWALDKVKVIKNETR